MIDTQVIGDPPACRGVAVWLTTYADNAQATADGCVDATSTADAGWSGPASEAFRAAVKDPFLLCEDITTSCNWYGRALSEFADELDGVLALMADAREDAAAGGLEVDGWVILPPELEHEYTSISDYRPPGPDAYDEYNEKVDVYNHCIDLAADARLKEAEAHERLHSMFQPMRSAPSGFDGETALQNWLDGGTEISSAVSAYLKAADMGLKDAQRQAKLLAIQADTQLMDALVTQFGLDTSDLSEVRRSIRELHTLAATDHLRAAERKRAELFGDLLRKVPKSVRDTVPVANDLYQWTTALRDLTKGDPEAAVETVLSEATLAALIKGGLKIRKLTPVGLVLSAMGADAVVNYAVDKTVGWLMPGEDEPNPYAQPKLDKLSPPSDTVGGYRTGTYH